MRENDPFGFAKLVPGFDFLQNLAQGASPSLPQMPSLSNWIAPTLNVDELDKRISELKAVHFWLDQNGKALGATIQALEVQKMTLATLQGMNFDLGDLADALKVKPTADAGRGADAMRQAAEGAGAARREAAAKSGTKSKAPEAPAGEAAAAAGAVDPLQWWGALTQQFQAIAANALQDVAQTAAPGAGGKRAAPAAKKAAAKSAPRKKSAKS